MMGWGRWRRRRREQGPAGRPPFVLYRGRQSPRVSRYLMDCYCFCHSSLRDLSRGGARLEKGRVRLTSARVPRDDDPAFASLLIHSRPPVVLCTPTVAPPRASMSLPPPHPPSLHTHSPALLRLAINNILDSERASPSASPHDWHDNVVVSHPPRYPSPLLPLLPFPFPSPGLPANPRLQKHKQPDGPPSDVQRRPERRRAPRDVVSAP